MVTIQNMIYLLFLKNQTLLTCNKYIANCIFIFTMLVSQILVSKTLIHLFGFARWMIRMQYYISQYLDMMCFVDKLHLTMEDFHIIADLSSLSNFLCINLGSL